MILFDIQRMTQVKAEILTSLAEAEPGTSGRAIAADMDYDNSVLFHTMWVMSCDGWIQQTEELEQDILYELTERGEQLLDLTQFGNQLREDSEHPGDTAE
jgi:DNA-binding MarR family transcriptional regulator